MKLKITAYKMSGKWYSEQTVELEDRPMWDDHFKDLIYENSGIINPEEFYITVEDAEPNHGFHQVLYAPGERHGNLKKAIL